ncbi:LOW QUALITY PROTEIN: sec1 family domain-containing protein 2-like, partial [Amphiura filiformis]|uniref:LOW QUALITY PROTEIN: sec1 family domain-containing protein 2-like n=1 Tax=Amphiura filiformis TaxID=82378 RepID=UPI003B21F261
VEKCSHIPWESICHHVNKAVVFLDAPAAECLHWVGGMQMMLKAGALNVKEFSSFENGSVEEKKAVFVVSDLLANTSEEVLQDIVTGSHFRQCIAVTTLPHSLHLHLLEHGGVEGANTSGEKIFRQLEGRMKRWMKVRQVQNPEAQVLHMPMFAATICNNLFVTPQHSSLFPLLDIELAQVKAQSKVQVDTQSTDSSTNLYVGLNMLPEELQTKIKVFVSGLSGFCEHLRVSEDVYAVGHTSRIIATELANLPSARARRKATQNRASILLLDRTLDLAGPAGHNRDTLADKIMSVLPRLQGHSTDVTVNMASLCSNGSRHNAEVVVPGCIAHPSDHTAQAVLNTFVIQKHKESLMELNRQLVDVISRENLPLNLAGSKWGRINADTVQKHLQLLKDHPKSLWKNAALAQLAMATVQTLTHPQTSHWDSILSTEKLLLMGDESGPSAISKITQLVQRNQSGERSHSLDEVIVLLIYAFSLMGDECSHNGSEVRKIQECLMDAILADEKPSQLITALVGEEKTEASVNHGVKKLFQKLQSIGKARDNLQRYKSIFTMGSDVHPASYNSILKQLVDVIFDPAKPELVDIENKSAGLRDLIKTGFRLFMNVSKPRPSDHPLVIIFVVGGVTPSEVRLVKEAVAAKSSTTQVVVGSTCLLRPEDVLRLGICQDNLHPE